MGRTHPDFLPGLWNFFDLRNHRWSRQISPFHVPETSACSASNHLSPPRVQPIFWLPRALDFAISQQARHDDRPNRVQLASTDQAFAFRCSPPRLAATQLRSTTGCRSHPDKDFHPAVSIRSRAHSDGQFARPTEAARSFCSSAGNTCARSHPNHSHRRARGKTFRTSHSDTPNAHRGLLPNRHRLPAYCHRSRTT